MRQHPEAREPARQRCIARACEGEGIALRPTEHTVHIGEDGRRLDPRQASARGPSEGVCPRATPALWYIDPHLRVAICCTWADVRQEETTEEVSELHYEHEERAEGKNGRCGQERAEDDEREDVRQQLAHCRGTHDFDTIGVRTTATRSASIQADTTPGAAAMSPSAAHMLKLAPSTIVRAR
eukprot:scaffold25384_cov30-Phaeocystis_antarctica.AAC.2